MPWGKTTAGPDGVGPLPRNEEQSCHPGPKGRLLMLGLPPPLQKVGILARVEGARLLPKLIR